MSLKGVPPPQTIPELHQSMMDGFAGVNMRLDGVEKEVGVVKKEVLEIKKDVKDIRQLIHDRAGTLTTHIVKDRVERSDPPDQHNTPMAAKGGEA